MALTPGTRIGVYEVTAQIGEGGMGQVYRATDTKLKRQVAIKILPPSLAADADRLARFQREAEVLASLNHPNIAAVYGLEESGGITALVMELVEGEDLSTLIARHASPEAESLRSRPRDNEAVPARGGGAPRGLNIDDALPIAKQIAEALEAAHEQGIIHRDLKPANIKLKVRGAPPPRTEDGRLERRLSAADLADCTVKVLDFGLAKAMEPPGAISPSASMSPTITTPAMMTGVGMILGTAAYMSPEQARGKAVDKRADIWAFGCVLFEMLTGTRAFGGDDVQDTFVAIMRDEPNWARLPATIPPALGTYIRRCLHKDPRQRIHDIADVRLALEGAFETTAPQTTASATASTPPGWLAWTAALVVAAVLIIALAIPALRYLRETPPSAAPEMRVDIVTPTTTDPISFALSPDGRQIVYVASGDSASRLWLRPLDKATAQPLAGTEGAQYPFWSPDSRSLGFFDGTKLKRVDLAGGSPQVLNNSTTRGGSWSPDGVILFAPTTTSPLFRISASGGAAVAVTKLEKQNSHRFPQFLPGGRLFLFYATGTPEVQGVYLGSLDAPETKRLTAADAAGVYDPVGPGPGGTFREDGLLLFIRGGTLLAQHLDLMRRALTGDPVTVANQVAVDSGFFGSAVSVSAAGLVAYRSGGANRRQLTWFDRAGKALGTVGGPDANGLVSPRLSPDGRRVAVHRTVQGNTDIWLLDTDRTTRFTFDPSLDRFPIWSPDGSRIAFDSNRKGHRDLYQKPSSGAGSEELLVESTQDKGAYDWSPDGRFLLYYSNDGQASFDLWVLPLEGDRKPFVFLKTNFDERRAQFSPDGKWVAYQSNESGRYEIYVRPFSGPSSSGGSDGRGGGQWQVSTSGGMSPRWGPGGKELEYIAPDGTLMAAPIVVTGATLEPGRPVALFHTRIVGGGTDLGVGTSYDIARDGRILIDTVLDDAASPITLLMNWNPEAKK